MANGFIKVADVIFPYPDRESGLQTQSTLVTGGLNSSGVFIGQQVGRVKSKVELSWAVMDAAQWQQLLRLFEPKYGGKFVNPVEYYDMVHGIITRKMYVNDRTARPFKVNPVTNIPQMFRDCKLNLIDTGE